MIGPIHGKFGLDSSGRMRNAEVRILPPQPRSRSRTPGRKPNMLNNRSNNFAMLSSLAELPELVGFFSYSRRDDETPAFRAQKFVLGIGRYPTHNSPMTKLHYDRSDYSVVVKNRASSPKAWRWEIYRAGNTNPIKRSSIYFDTTASAKRAGKDALTELLKKLFS